MNDPKNNATQPPTYAAGGVVPPVTYPPEVKFRSHAEIRARAIRNLFVALVNEGFTEEQATRIVSPQQTFGSEV